MEKIANLTGFELRYVVHRAMHGAAKSDALIALGRRSILADPRARLPLYDVAPALWTRLQIDHEISVAHAGRDTWIADISLGEHPNATPGPTPGVAVCRAYAISELGETVEIPEWL